MLFAKLKQMEAPTVGKIDFIEKAGHSFCGGQQDSVGRIRHDFGEDSYLHFPCLAVL